MKFLPKNLCKRLSVINGIGVCNLMDCLCHCWNCEVKEKCGKEVFTKCQLKSGEFKEIPNAVNLYEDAIRSANTEIRSIIYTEDPMKITGGLLFRREDEILHCFCEAPGDLPYAVSAANSLISQDLSSIDHDDIKYTEEANKIWNLIVAREVSSNQAARLKNKDIICFGNEKGKEELADLVLNPIKDIEKLEGYIRRKTPPPIEGQNVRLFYSRSMLPVIEWCRGNINQTDMWDYTLYENFGKILEHLKEVGKTGEVSPRICYKLGYPHYAGMLHTCRYIYSKFKHIKAISLLNKGIEDALLTKYSISFEIGKNYDTFLFDLWLSEKKEKLCTDEKIGQDLKEYRFIIGDGTLFGSLILMGFMSKNYESICLKPYERGPVFEDFVEKELLDRQVSILKRNLETPKGEVDFICEKKGKIFYIEAKDYSPWFDDNYIGSKTYNERVESISEKLKNAPPRMQWIESNPDAVGLSSPLKMQGIILTRFSEPHICLPPKFQPLTINTLDICFGQSNKHKIYETHLRFTASKEERARVKSEILANQSKASTEFGLR